MNRHVKKIYDMRMKDLDPAKLRCHGLYKRAHGRIGPGMWKWTTEGAWELKRPSTRAYSVQVAVFGGHIAIGGDLAPFTGLVTNMPQGLAWWLKASSPQYLGEKFGIPKLWHPEACADELLDLYKDADDYGADRDQLLNLAQRCQALRGGADANSLDAWQLQEEIYGTGLCDDGMLGWIYDPNALGFLVAVQQVFRDRWFGAKEEGFFAGELAAPIEVPDV